jgi:PAS domain S-box-containing protein
MSEAATPIALEDDDGVFRCLADGLPQGLIVHRDFVPLYANPAAAVVLGFETPADLVASASLSAVFPDDLDRDPDPVPTGHRVRVERPDGSPALLELRVSEIEWSDGKAACFSFHDVSMQESAEVALRASEATYRRLFENVPDGIFRVTADRRVLEINPALARMVGYDDPDELKEVLATPGTTVFLDPDGWSKAVGQLRQDGIVKDYQAEWRCKDGSVIWVSLNLAAVEEEIGLVIEGSAVDITEQRDAALSLLRAKEAAEIANHAKSEFLAHMSHELRTPLNCVIGFSQILMNEMFGPLGRDSYREYATDINTAGNHLLGLISDILDISKIEAGELEIIDVPVDLGELLLHCMTMMRDRADTAGVTLGVDFDRELPMISADELRIKQIVLNLLSNAVKFTPQGGRIRISAFVDADRSMVIRVVDTGVGIASEDIERVLAPFEQVRLAPTLSHEGTGLGLYLTKSLAEMLDGAIAIESAPGEGTQVTVTLPPARTLAGPASMAKHGNGDDID